MRKQYLGRACPDCGSENIATERRPNGDSICADCGCKDKTSEFDVYSLEREPLVLCFDTKVNDKLLCKNFETVAGQHNVFQVSDGQIFEHDGEYYDIRFAITATITKIKDLKND